jgi:hypothetical protein
MLSVPLAEPIVSRWSDLTTSLGFKLGKIFIVTTYLGQFSIIKKGTVNDPRVVLIPWKLSRKMAIYCSPCKFSQPNCWAEIW